MCRIYNLLSKILGIVAPLRTGHCSNNGGRGRRWLSAEAVESRKTRRKLERRWKSTGHESDRVEYQNSCRATNRLIIESQHRENQRVVNEAAGNARRQWSVVNDLLYAKPDPEPTTAKVEQLLCQNLLQFFTDKGVNIASSIRAKLTGSTVDPYIYDQPHNGPTLDDLPVVTIEEVTRILSEMPCKSSPMDFVPTSLLKSCSDMFAPIIARLANLSFTEGLFLTNFKWAQITPLLKRMPRQSFTDRKSTRLNSSHRL